MQKERPAWQDQNFVLLAQRANLPRHKEWKHVKIVLLDGTNPKNLNQALAAKYVQQAGVLFSMKMPKKSAVALFALTLRDRTIAATTSTSTYHQHHASAVLLDLPASVPLYFLKSKQSLAGSSVSTIRTSLSSALFLALVLVDQIQRSREK